MTNRDIVRLAAFYLQLEDVLAHPAMSDYYYSGELGGSDSTTNTIRQLLRCCDLTVKTVAAEYFPLIATCGADVKDGKIDLSCVPDNVIEALEIIENGKKKKFKQSNSAIFTSATGKVLITYTYEPKSGGLDARVFYLDSAARIFAYGTAAEYCIISAMYDEAALWDRRFKDAMRNLRRDK